MCSNSQNIRSLDFHIFRFCDSLEHMPASLDKLKYGNTINLQLRNRRKTYISCMSFSSKSTLKEISIFIWSHHIQLITFLKKKWCWLICFNRFTSKIRLMNHLKNVFCQKLFILIKILLFNMEIKPQQNIILQL